MNIKKLIEQATTIEEHGWGASYEHFDKEKFAELVAAHEREECAKLCEELLERPSGYQGRWKGYGKFKSQMTGQECASAIRARGKV